MKRSLMKMLHPPAMKCLFLILILTVHAVPEVRSKIPCLNCFKASQKNVPANHQGTGNKFYMDEYLRSIDDDFDNCRKEINSSSSGPILSQLLLVLVEGLHWVTMKTQHSAAVMHLFIIHIILTMHMALGAPAQNSKIYMDEYVNSIDDEFLTCKEDMYWHITTKQLLNRELTFNVNFAKAWAQASNYLVSKGKVFQPAWWKDNLRNTALCAYTTEHIYRDLNNRMRAGRDSYTHFGLISLHFLITDAIQRRNPMGACQTTYRRTGVAIVIEENKLVRFGTFTSSTRSPNNLNFKGFGRETCFVIYTCYGAHISDVSVFPNEDEVLIPPYERFTGRRLAFSPELADCKLVYELRSKGKKSNMKCKYVNQQKGLPPKTGLWPTG
ncbi:hypothetical protein NFI96_001121 [Prochilodus magdalenae]|nr:hypothetical protein NFI96_001121 [Prochilodus magdalenae]